MACITCFLRHESILTCVISNEIIRLGMLAKINLFLVTISQENFLTVCLYTFF